MFRLALPVIVLLLLTACSKTEEAPQPPAQPAAPVAAPAPAPVPEPAPAPVPEPVIAPAVPADAQSRPAAPPKSKTLAPGVTAASGTYTVAKGDTLYRIARTHGVKVRDLMAWNHIKRADRLRIGQKLRLSGK